MATSRIVHPEPVTPVHNRVAEMLAHPARMPPDLRVSIRRLPFDSWQQVEASGRPDALLPQQCGSTSPPPPGVRGLHPGARRIYCLIRFGNIDACAKFIVSSHFNGTPTRRLRHECHDVLTQAFRSRGNVAMGSS